jgi:hypothetical protein
MVVPPSVPPLPKPIAAVTTTPDWLTGVFDAFRSWMAACWASATPLCAVADGCVVIASCVAGAACTVSVAEPEMPSLVAEICVVPTATALTAPALVTVATLVVLLA